MSRLQELEDVPVEVNTAIDLSAASYNTIRVFIDQHPPDPKDDPCEEDEDDPDSPKGPDFIVARDMFMQHADIGYSRTKQGRLALYLGSEEYIDADTFNDYLNWLYRGEIPLNETFFPRIRTSEATYGPPPDAEDSQYVQLARLFKAAEYLDDDICQDTVLNMIAAKAHGPKKWRCAQLPGSEAMYMMRGETLEKQQSKGWQLLLALYADLANDEAIDLIEDNHFKDCLLRMLLSRRRTERPEAVITTVCQFHQHGEGKECKSRKRKRVD